jgi:4-amino-4-deoxy-L-arabinose transferase-like glycosyltransferase
VELAALAGILVGALALRLVGLGAGLPGPGLLSPDEDTVVPKALGLLERGSLNPDWFLYPSLYLTLLAGLLGLVGLVASGPPGVPFASSAAYSFDPTTYILTGRLVSVVAGVGLVAATWALGRRAFGRSAGLVGAALVAVAPVAVAYSRVAVTDMAMTALLTVSLLLLVTAASRRSRRALLWAALVAGLATSCKYNAGLVVLPVAGVAVALARGAGAGALRSARAACAPVGLMLAGFLAGTPFAVLDPVTFARDFWRQNRIVADGWLGFEGAGPGVLFNVHPVLWGAMGGGVLILALVGLGVAAWRRTPADLVLAPFCVVYFLYVSSWSAHFDRYLLPIVPVLAILGARGAVELARAARARRLRAGRALALAALAGSLAWTASLSLGMVSELRRRDLRLDAAATVTRLVPLGGVVAVDPLGPPLVGAREGRRLRRAGLDTHWFRLVRLETPRPGAVPDRRRSLARLRRDGVRWLVTSDSVARRVLAAPGRYPAESRFYRELRARATLVARVPRSLGPGVKLWDLSRRPPMPANTRTAQGPPLRVSLR